MRGLERLIPAAKPWVLIDQIDAIDGGRRIRCIKQISASDFFLLGHFEYRSVYPGVILLAAFRQAAELLLAAEPGRTPGVPTALSEVDARWLQPVIPGDRVTIEVTAGNGAKWHASATVAGQMVARAVFRLRPLELA